MKDLLHALRLCHVEAGLPDLYEQARLHSLTYESFLRRVLLLEIEGRKLVVGQSPHAHRSQPGAAGSSPVADEAARAAFS